MTPAQIALREALEKMRDLVKPEHGLVYRFGWDFVLQHGKWYEPCPYPDIPSGLPKRCYATSILQAADRGWKYVEGYAFMPRDKGFSWVPIHHAWNATLEGLVDSTWDNGGDAYFGVEFDVERAQDATWEGDASVLDDFRRGWPLFKQRWEGEREWPESEFTKLVRDRDEEGLLSWMEKNL